MRVSMVMAMDSNRLIGKGGKLPWHLPSEMAYFKATTMGKALIMGRKTWESLGRPLPGRISIVVTSTPSVLEDSNREHIASGKLHVCTSLNAAIELARELHQSDERAVLVHDEAAVIGGAKLCEEAMAVTDTLYLSIIKAEFEGDTWLESFKESDWREVSVDSVHVDGYEVDYRVLERS